VEIAALRIASLRLADLGLRNALPAAGPAGEQDAALVACAQSLAERTRARLDALDAMRKQWQNEDGPGAADGAAPVANALRVRRCEQGLHALLGKAVPLLPRFTLPDGSAAAAVFARSDELLAGAPANAFAWLDKVGKARPDVASLQDALAVRQLLSDEAPLWAVIGQLPDQVTWAATSAPADPKQAYLCLFALDEGGLAAAAAERPLAGLLVDTWIDQIPAPEVLTGVAMHFDAPSARAPQSLLLVVPPSGERFGFDFVVDSLLATLEAAQLRTVDPDVLQAYGHQMPIIFPPRKLDAGVKLDDDHD
jgi:hypothetical protein